jgi:hypothetical protein
MRQRVDAVDALYDVAPTRFVAARARLAARLRRAGKSDVARAVAKLPRISAVVWAINRVARRDEGLVSRLVSALERLERAQRHRHPVGIDAANAEMAAAAAPAVARAACYMREAGLAVTPATRRRLDTTLRGAAAYERQALREGVLTHELVAPGVDIFNRVHLRALPLPPSRARRAALSGAVAAMAAS